MDNEMNETFEKIETTQDCRAIYRNVALSNE